MVGLLSELDLLEIRQAVQTVTDTFFVTPIEYLKGKDQLSRFNEDNSFVEYDTYTLMGLAEYASSTGGKYGTVQNTVQGSKDRSQVRVSLNTEDLIALGLYDEIEHKVNFLPEKDWMNINGEKYKVKTVHSEGPLDRKNLIITVFGEMLLRKT